VRGPTLYQKFCTSKLKKRRTASSVWQLARAAAASGAVSSPAPAAGSPSVRANVSMSEAEGGWSDLLHESALEASSSQASANPASVPEPGVTLPQQTRYAVSPQKGSTAVTMAHFFGPVGSTASGAGKGLVTRTKNSYVQMEGKTVQLQHSRTEDIETVAGPKAGSCAKQWSCPKNCGFSTKHPPALTRHLQAGKCKPLQKVIDGDTSPGNQTGPPAGCSSSAASEGTARSSRVAAASGGTADDVGQALPTEEARVGQKRKKDGTLKTSGIREGEKRKVYSIFYRYAVVLKCNKFKEKGDKTPTDSTATIFGVHKSCVSKWNKQADQLRQALQSPDRQMPGHVYHVSDEHPSAKRILLGREPASF